MGYTSRAMPEECSVRFTRRYAAVPAEVWRALTEPESLERWLRPGFPVPQREVEHERLLELDWKPPGEEPSVVRIELAPSGTGTKLVLDHERIQAVQGMAAMRFWFAALGTFPLEAQGKAT
jgi:uncharacterized protein YndB with AHSA1/START domain